MVIFLVTLTYSRILEVLILTDGADIKAQSFTNDNNFVISFYNFGRYIHRILIFY